jgi:hypothetical protein
MILGGKGTEFGFRTVCRETLVDMFFYSSNADLCTPFYISTGTGVLKE